MKSKINRVLCFVLALTMVVLCVPLTSQNAEAANSLSDIITDKEFLTQAAKLLPSQHGSTVVYGNDVPGNYGKNTYWMKEASAISNIDCTGFLWWTLSSLGLKITWDASNSNYDQNQWPVPYDIYGWQRLTAFCDEEGGSATVTRGSDSWTLRATKYWGIPNGEWWNYVPANSLLVVNEVPYPNSAPYGDNTGNHGVYYIGAYDDVQAVIDHFAELGITITEADFQTMGDGTHWVIESTTGHGNTAVNAVKITNPPTLAKGSVDTINIIVTPIPKDEQYKSYVKKTDAAGNGVANVTFGVYTDEGCTVSFSEQALITTDNNGIAVTINYPTSKTLYAKEVSAPDAYIIDSTPVQMTEVKASESVPSSVATIVNSEKGNLSIRKIIDNDPTKTANVAGWTFTVQGMVGGNVISTNTATTGADGYANLYNLPVYQIVNNQPTGISYHITETGAPSGVTWFYDATGVQDVYLTPVNAGNIQTKTVEWYNNSKTIKVQVVKTAEDGVLAGHKFNLSGRADSGELVNRTVTTGNDGVADFGQVPVGSNYTLEEKDTASRYTVPASQTISLVWNGDYSPADQPVVQSNFVNTLKEFELNIWKRDNVTGAQAQGGATLKGAQFTLRKGTQVLGVYTTDENGYAHTGKFVCGDDYTIQETKAPNGYVLDSTIYPLNGTQADGDGNRVSVKAEGFTGGQNTVNYVKNDEVVTGKIGLTKYYGEENDALIEKGAEFEVFLKSAGDYAHAKQDERDKLVTGEYGTAISKDLPFGTYTVHQTKGIAGHQKVEDFDLVIDSSVMTKPSHLVTKDEALINTPYKGHIKVTKIDAESGKVIPVPGATFEIYRKIDATHEELVSFTVYDINLGKDVVLSTYKTNDEGVLFTPFELTYGDYYLKEVEAPVGYLLNDILKPFSVTESNIYSGDYGGITYDHILDVQFEDTKQYGRVEITKTGEAFTAVEDNGEDGLVPVFTEVGLKGGIFGIYAKEDIYTPDEPNTPVYTKDQLVTRVTTGDNGKATSPKLPLGKYYIKELKAPVGYLLNDEVTPFTLTYNKQVQEVKVKTSMFDVRQRVQFNLLKAMEVDELFDLGTHNEIDNVVFGLYAKNKITSAYTNATIAKNALICKMTVDEDGTVTLPDNIELPLGSYYFKEIGTDEHYILDDSEFFFK